MLSGSHIPKVPASFLTSSSLVGLSAKAQGQALAESMTEHFQFPTQFRLVLFTAVWVQLGESYLKHFEFLEGLQSFLKNCIFFSFPGGRIPIL